LPGWRIGSCREGVSEVVGMMYLEVAGVTYLEVVGVTYLEDAVLVGFYAVY